MLAPLLTLLISVCTAAAQTQEKKLVDRLLRPDTSLMNPAQEKKFVGPAGGSFNQRIPPRSFYSREKNFTKPFSGEQTLTPQQVAAGRFRTDNSRANLSTRTDIPHKERAIRPAPAPGLRAASEGNAIVDVGDFAGSRPFLGRGKRQRALQAYNRSLTIEQVRELLNKSK